MLEKLENMYQKKMRITMNCEHCKDTTCSARKTAGLCTRSYVTYGNAIEIPFGVNDSELHGFEYTIPEGYEAEIKGGKVIVKQAESEDEKMVKFIKNQLFNIKKTITDNYELDTELTKAIDWLEKQVEQKPTDKVESKFKVGDWIVQNGLGVYKILEVCESWYEVIAYNDGIQYSIGFDKENDCNLWTIEDAKDGDILVTQNRNIIIFKELNGTTVYDYCGLYFDKFYDDSSPVNGTFSTELPKGYVPATKEQRDLLFQKMKEAGYEWDADKKELKKVNQKPADTPKFNVGDWVIDEQGIIDQISAIVENVTNHTYGYDTINGEYFNDSTEGVRLWNIEDAKDGDILVTQNQNIIIFKEINGTTIYDYCGLYFNEFCGGSNPVNGTFDTEPPKGYVPATKEQRDLLFQKMKEAGYEWDSDKKELKKIEQKSAWSEEDVAMLDSAIAFVEHSAFTTIGKGKDNVIAWLKSLRPQNKWKPSEEQMKALEYQIHSTYEGSWQYEASKELLEQLKKLYHNEDIADCNNDNASALCLKEAEKVLKDKESFIKFLKEAGIMDESGNLSKEYKMEQEAIDYCRGSGEE